jgi:DNA-binding NtrC family response regulator
MASRILIIEDEALLARNLARYLQRARHEVVTAGTVADGEARYDEAAPDVLIIDHNLPDGTGTDLIRRIRRNDLSTKIIMMTAHGNVAVAVEAMRAGADDYVTKPVSLDEMGLLVDRLVSRSAAEETLAYLRRREESRSGLDQIVGASAAIVAMKQRIGQVLAMEARQVEGTPPPVLITGETGTGKELVARALHFDGKRRSAPFVEINCAALPGHLIESELFGHEKGAFTDARERRVGLIQSADHGTLFLDEIGDMSLVAQAKLLKVLEEGRVRPLGSTRDRAVDVRIVAATNAAIEARTRDGTFRSDLYYRLCGVSIATPRLRDREGDVLLLARHFLQMHCKRYGRAGMTLGPAAEAPLLRHTWPGNVRELSNVIEQAAMLATADEIGDADLMLREPPPSEDAPVTGEGPSTLQSIERDQIAQALARSSGNVTVAAEALGISRDTLRYRMERHGIRRGSFVP